MPRRKIGPHHNKAGRPPYDDLQLFLMIEAGRRLVDQSVYAYTRHRYLPVRRGGEGGGVIAVISGNSLHGHYYRAKRTLCPDHVGPGPLPAPIERLVQDMMHAMQ